MIDEEKVIKGLECCANDKPFYHAHCDECPYNGRRPDNMGGCTKLYRDTLELLKEQESIEPIITDDPYALIHCGYCDETIHITNKYCPSCGRKIKWNEP